MLFKHDNNPGIHRSEVLQCVASELKKYAVLSCLYALNNFFSQVITV
jgi:hypothetical protein